MSIVSMTDRQFASMFIRNFSQDVEDGGFYRLPCVVVSMNPVRVMVAPDLEVEVDCWDPNLKVWDQTTIMTACSETTPDGLYFEVG